MKDIRTEIVAGITTFFTTQGILWGFISHTGLYLASGRRRELHPMMYGLAAVSIGLLLLEAPW